MKAWILRACFVAPAVTVIAIGAALGVAGASSVDGSQTTVVSVDPPPVVSSTPVAMADPPPPVITPISVPVGNHSTDSAPTQTMAQTITLVILPG